ncbi:MAG: T9SS type A sorting domain-containing protein [Bacteroidetes bacterium]|nr:T9SS type A sorting domain-containing protein [Bacteroidota bacterium]
MRTFFLLFTICLVQNMSRAQVTNPIPELIEASGLEYQLSEYGVVPESSSSKPKARINVLRQEPGGKRLFVNDLRGSLWAMEAGESSLFLDLKAQFPAFVDEPGKGTGFGAVAFHPDYANNGKFYTSHAESSGSGVADFSPIVNNGIALQWVVYEWTMDDPASAEFEGTSKEVFRADFPYVLHGIQDMQFNPNAEPGDYEYGLLYICLGDGGSSLNFLPENLQTPESYLGTIFCIDPSGNDSANGNYGIPSENPFANDGDPNTLGEIWAYGFRNPHRISWDTEGEGIMLIGDIGEKNIEELNLGVKGGNYGWDNREGTFLYDREIGTTTVFELPPDDAMYNYIYPVAQYDHDDGVAIVGGFVYRGTQFPELYGQYIFGDIKSGRIFHVPVEELELGSQATIREITLIGNNGDETNLLATVFYSRADLHFGVDDSGELYILTKADGTIRQFKEVGSVSIQEPQTIRMDFVSPNPGNGLFVLNWPEGKRGPAKIQVVDARGKLLRQISLNGYETSIDLSDLPQGNYWLTGVFGETKHYTMQLMIIRE